MREDVPLPEDTAAIIETAGLFGAKYIELQPGGALDNLAPGDSISYTQDAVILEELLAKIVARAKAARGLSDGRPDNANADSGGSGFDGGDGGVDGGAAGGKINPFPSLLD